MEKLIEEVKQQVIAKAKKENRRDFDNLFREVMNNRMSFYRTFNENFSLNVTNIQHFLENMERKVFRIEAVKEKNCYTCKYIKFNNGYGRCAESGFLVNESNYCSGWRNQKWMEKSKMITREKALKKIYFLYEDGFCKEDLGILINRIYDSFEEREIFLSTKDVLCNDCIYYLSDNGNYPLEPCTDCSRFYADKFVRNKPL